MTERDGPAAYRALHAATEGVLRDVVELHRPTTDGWETCGGCPEGDDPDYWVVWPCRTTVLIAERVGVSLREDVYTIDAEPARAMVPDRPSYRPELLDVSRPGGPPETVPGLPRRP